MISPCRTLTAIRALLTCLCLAVFGVLPATAQDEIIYLTNTRVQDDDGTQVTQLFLVDIDEIAGTAAVTLVDTIDLQKVDALACSPDDRRCYLIDRYDPVFWPDGGTLGVYLTETGTFTVVGDVVDENGDRIIGIVLAGHSPGPVGQVILGSQFTDHLYSLDVTTGVATSIGPIYVAGTATEVNLDGADLVFTSDSRLFVWANGSRLPDAPFGLYEVDLPEIVGGVAIGVPLGTGGQPQDAFFTGLAVRGNGLGNLVGMNRLDQLQERGRDGALIDIFAVQRDGAPLEHFAGDMHHSFDCFMEIALDRPVAAPGETVTLTTNLVHNRPRTVYTWFELTITEVETGRRLVSRKSPTRTLRWGDHLTFQIPIPIPSGIGAGLFQVDLAIDDMRQGKVTKTVILEVRR